MLSTFAGETVDSIIFFPIAFGGLIALPDLLMLMLTQTVLKTMYEVIVLPVTIRVVNKLKSIEGIDVFDENISYNFLKF